MKEFLQTLQARNHTFYILGWFCLVATLICALLTQITDTQVLGISAWVKPMKFYLSTAILVWTLGWLLHHLKSPHAVKIYTWIVVSIFVFELAYITYKAAVGELSHFDTSSQFNATMFQLMGIAISIMTLWTAYMGVLFFVKKFPELPKAYLWGIRLGILLFVIFAFEGMAMGARMSHTVGAGDGGEGLPIVNWSTKHGDLRIAHFLGMHALQIVPLVAWYLLKKTWQVVLFALLYGAGVTYVLMQALSGNPLINL